ncbi:MAG: LacI family transcriptional regulator [Sulfobacillus benefaciens]|uniref:LacI family transcriptional regulator n=1 Tax=Sulfobacillus benefaciens TaxID=453960 RepID=A0A2T2X970_9FIRM|nr:MAG: LacI family transcriptional regulator [Sulfobacillus benefaciens]
MPTMKTLRDVALHARVSVATVSRVISGDYPVKEETRRRVLEAINALDYHPNGVARSLKSAKTYTLGVLVPDMANPYFIQIARALEAVVESSGYHLLVASSDEDAEKEIGLIKVFLEKRLDGMVIAPAAVSLSPELASFLSSTLSVVLIDRVLDGVEVGSVREESRQASKLLVRHLVSQGHREIAMITGRKLTTTSLEREAGYRDALQEAHIPFCETYLMWGDYDQETGYLGGKRFLSMKDRRPSAVFCANNLITLGFLHAVDEVGLRVPDDISVVSFGDPFEATFMTPKMTIVVQNPADVGRFAGRMLLRKLERNSTVHDTEEVVLPTEIRLGSSTRSLVVN